MLRTLRNQLILSHVLPLLIIIPLVGVLLIYTLDNVFLMPALSREVIQDAQLIADITEHHRDAWQDPQAAQMLLGASMDTPAKRVMLLTPEGRILASNRAEDAQRAGNSLSPDEWKPAAVEEAVLVHHEDPSLEMEIVDAFVPVRDTAGDVEGIVRVSHSYATLRRDFLRTRGVIGAILIVSLLVGTALGLVLAISVATPLQAVTGAVYDVASGRKSDRLPEDGPQEMRRLLRAVNHLTERLAALQSARRQLLANVVHELGRPLGALQVALQALQRGAADDLTLREELMNGMAEALARLQIVVEDLSHLHDQDVGALELAQETLEMGTWLPPILASWQIMARKKGLQWQVLLETEPLPFKADPLRLSQALGNLVSNAIKYTARGGSVTVSAGRDEEGNWIYLAVSDTGRGIAAEEQQAIFEPFFRGGEEPVIKQGLGLGLSIARNYVLAHGGRLTLQSEVGRGSTFTIWLPPEKPGVKEATKPDLETL